MEKSMQEMNGHGSIYGTIVTVFLYFLTVFNIQQWAAMATIFAGVTTGAFTIYKWWRLHNKKQNNDRISEENNEK